VFTGLVEATATVSGVERDGAGARIEVATPLAADLTAGDSVAVNGVCLTAVETDGERFTADVMAETLRRSSLGPLAAGDSVNVELPLRADGRLGGHMVQGHVDATGTVADVQGDGFARVVTVACERDLLRYVVEKGSIAVDGVSLTVASVDERGFTVSLIPETLERTTLGGVSRGDVVNLEVDVLAKYVEKLVART
jgi:riboflavin synthase